MSPDDDHDGFTVCAGDCNDGSILTYPGATQVCDGVNNDCGHLSWPALAGINEADDDGHSLSECQGDCDDANAAVWSTPGEVRDVTLRADGITLEWRVPADAGATSLSYDTLRSAVADDFVGNAFCVESDDGADTVSTDGSIPAPGEIFCYLVRAENGCSGSVGIGPLGDRSDGTPRTGRTFP